ncbi:hypothetical protein AVM02_15340 [Brucella anthropi]
MGLFPDSIYERMKGTAQILVMAWRKWWISRTGAERTPKHSPEKLQTFRIRLCVRENDVSTGSFASSRKVADFSDQIMRLQNSKRHLQPARAEIP